MQTKKFLILVDLLKKTDYNAKITEIESKIPSISGLATTAGLPAVENEKTDVRNLVKKKRTTDYNTKINETEKKITDHNRDKYITTPEFNRPKTKNFAARLAQANLVTKADFDNELTNLNKKTNSNKTKHVLVKNKTCTC